MGMENKERFEAMYLEYQDTLRRLAYAYDVPRDYIDDVVQDAFVEYARYDYSVEQPVEGIKTLLCRIIKSRCMDFHRRRDFQYCVDLDDEDFTMEDYRLQSGQPSLADYMVEKERCHALLEEINRMPPNWKSVASLKLIEGRPTEEVCAILNISEKACYSRVSRIRKYIETLLNDENWP